MNRIYRFMLFVPFLAAVAGCAALYNPGVYKGDALFQQRKYAEALTSYRQALSQTSSRQDAEARYAIAFILAYHDNSHRNYAQALEAFEDFLRRYPDHDKASSARNWKGVLRTLQDEKRECEQLKTRIEQLKKLDIRHEEKRKGR